MSMKIVLISLISLIGFSLAKDSLKWNHFQTIGTHNSYHHVSEPTISAWDYSHPNMTVQLEHGIRQFELDVSWPVGNVQHMFIFDGVVNCLSLQWCLDYFMKDWRAKNPSHMPLFVLIEFKDTMTPRDYDDYDQELILIVQRENIFTPDDLRKELEADEKQTLRDIVLTKGWPSIESARGKFVFVLHGNRPNYTQGKHENSKGRLSFMAHRLSESNQDNAAILYDDWPNKNGDKIKELVQQGFIVRTRSDVDYHKGHPGKVFTKKFLRDEYFTVLDRPPEDKKISKMEFNNWLDHGMKIPSYEKIVDQLFEQCTNNDKITKIDRDGFDCLFEAFLTKFNISEPTIPTKEAVISQRDKAFESGAHFVSTDFFLEPENTDDYWVKFPGDVKTPYRCNPVTTKNIACSDSDFEGATEKLELKGEKDEL